MLFDLDIKNTTIKCLAFMGFVISFIIQQSLYILALYWIMMAYLISGDRPTYIYTLAVTLSRDIRILIKSIEIRLKLNWWKQQNMTVAKLFEKTVKRNPEKIAMIMENESITFEEADNFSNKIAIYFKSRGFKRGDVVSLFMETRLEYPFIWLGLSKIGVISALINSNLKKDTLLHSLKVANTKAIIVGSELVTVLEEIFNVPGVRDLPIFQYRDMKQEQDQNISILEGFEDLSSELEGDNPTDLISDISKGKPTDTLVYIYTSGTTGMSKASVITNIRYLLMSVTSNVMLRIRSNDIIYCALPLYHTGGGLLVFGNVILSGTTIAIKRKFSVNDFWTDCIKYKCTLAFYIGELCRYLLSAPPMPVDTQHSLRFMFGIGLRREIWKDFTTRFNISKMVELYGSTEGNLVLLNFDNTIGAVGFTPISIGNHLRPIFLVRYDEDTGDPIRNSDGRCIECKPDKSGVCIMLIDARNVNTTFDGYTDKEATEKAILRNVFCSGDAYFNTGDVLMKDILGYFYFKDRTGDTFRWRGVNVAASEIEGIIKTAANLINCAVYGVKIPHCEGKAGMAAILDPDKSINIEKLNTCINENLPKFARPIFIRLSSHLPTTETLKLKKYELQADGYDLKKIKDPIYFLNNDGIYKPFTEKIHEDIINGRLWF